MFLRSMAGGIGKIRHGSAELGKIGGSGPAPDTLQHDGLRKRRPADLLGGFHIPGRAAAGDLLFRELGKLGGGGIPLGLLLVPGTSTITLKPLKVKHFRGLIFYGDRFGDHLKIREYFPIYLLIIFRIQFTAEAQMI